MASYEEFARVYDTIMDDSLYEQWFDFSLRHFPEKTKKIMELACGTGILSIRFEQAGFDVTGVDLSEEMLTIADRRAHEAQAKIDFQVGDMRELATGEPFDTITCYSDSLCYMANLAEVQQVFDGVWANLRENGVFIFDVHSIHQIDDNFPDYSYHENEEDFAFLWDSFAGEFPHSIVHELTFFVKDEQGKFIRKDEVHNERTYEINDYLTALSAFSEVVVYADFTDEAPNNQSLRWFFVCQK